MPITSIIIDNKQTTAKRIAPDKVQLDLVALPLDEQNDAEPNMDIRLYVNGQLLQNLQSSADGRIKEMIVIDSSDAEQLTITLEDVVQGVKSNIKCIMIAELVTEKKPEVDPKLQSLYGLHKEVFNEFALIDNYFKALIKPENGHDEQFVRGEFDKISILAELKYQIKNAKELEFYDEYKDGIEKKITYCKNEMTIHEIDTLLQDIKGIINIHDANSSNIRNQREQATIKAEQEKNRLQQEENNKKEIEKNQKIQEEKQKKRDSITQQINNITICRDGLTKERDKLSNSLNRMIDIEKEMGRLNDLVDKDTKRVNALPEIISLSKEWFRISNERTQALKGKIDHQGKISQLYSDKMNVVNGKLQKYYELLGNLVGTVGGCPTEQKIQEYENHCKTHINYYSGLILQQKKDKDTLENEIGHKDEKTLNNLNNEINRLFTQIQTITNEKNAI